MRDNLTTLPPEELEERAAIAFLEQFVADRVSGSARPLAAYAALFPRFEARIAREWLLMTDRLPRPTEPISAASDPDRIGPYRLESELGRGGQGVVYLAEDTRLGRRVALKVLTRDLTSLSGPAILRLQREADAVARLEHPGIATVYETGHDEQTAWIAMRYVAGGSVRDAINHRLAGGLGPPQQRDELRGVIRLAERAARALAAAHRAGILHRDIKPANILLAGPDEPVLVDFGLAADDDARTPTITMPGAVFGTLCYLSPERLAGERADARADVHALGAVLFELLTLQRPYAAPTTAGELKAIADSPVPDVRSRNSAVSRDLATVVQVALAKSPTDRYQTAAAFADDLERLLARQPIAARPASAAVRVQRWAERNPGLAVSLGAIALVLAIGLATTSWLWHKNAAALADVERLADLRLTLELVQRADALWPARPEQAAAMVAWQSEVVRLQERLPVHRQRLTVVDAAAITPTSAWEKEQLTALLAEHERLAALVPVIATRLEAATTLPRRSIDDHRTAWDHAIARIAASPHYGGLQLAPQLGLVPLGPDPRSGLEEFAHIASGAIPARGENSELRLDGSSALVLVLIPGGPALLGAEARPPTDGHRANVDPSAQPELGPCFAIDLEPFLLSKFEFTQEQWERHVGRNPSAYRVGGAMSKVTGERHPVELVSWRDAERTARQLDLQLPTEAQWEQAYRAGTQTPYPYGEAAQSLIGHENLADATARRTSGHDRWPFQDWLDDGHLVHAPVGTFQPNAFGLHDMGGNVKEWCQDSWENLDECAPRQGDGLREGQYQQLRIIRGGSYASSAEEARSANRGGTDRETSGGEAGVRPARRLAR